MLYKTFFRNLLSFLDAEIFRFFMLQMARNTLYILASSNDPDAVLICDKQSTTSSQNDQFNNKLNSPFQCKETLPISFPHYLYFQSF